MAIKLKKKVKPGLRVRFRRRYLSPSMWKRRGWLGINRRIKFAYLRLLRLPGTSHKVALGLAIGILTGFLPIIPLQTLTAFTLCLIFRGNFPASLPGIQITNPLTIAPFYFLFFQIGQRISPYGRQDVLPPIEELVAMSWGEMLGPLREIFLAMFFGGLLLGLIFAPIFYLVTRLYLERLREYEHRKIRLRFDITSKTA